MKRKFDIEVDCANCAAKIEAAIQKIEGVQSASVSFMTQKLTLEEPDDRFDEILKEEAKKEKKIEPDFEIDL